LGEPLAAAACRPPQATSGVSWQFVRSLYLEDEIFGSIFSAALANWAIFLDHIPNNTVAWLTIRNYGFSDAADIFVFISG